MKEQLRQYILELQQRRQDLTIELAEVEKELKEFKDLTTVTKEPVTRSIKCNTCNGTGEYDDRWAGLIDCPDCNGFGYKSVRNY